MSSLAALQQRGRGTHLGIAPAIPTSYKITGYLNILESITEAGDSPLGENLLSCLCGHPSTAEHEKFCGNLPGLSGKAKYSCVTDSELVPRGKGEKYS